ncbi:hypothetical protein P4K10_00115 [Bacillus anthracis]|nr:hypothetical protein [Bacillus thuringiensis]MEB9626465.1 hypothetical protein [Bacillus anthracis]
MKVKGEWCYLYRAIE